MKSVLAVVLSLAILTTISCGKKNKLYTQGGPFSGDFNASGFVFDASVPANQQELFSLDYSNAGRLALSAPPSETYKSYFDIPDYSGPSWARWLNDRIKYIVGEDWDWEDHVTYQPKSYQPLLSREAFEPFQQIVTLMENAGSGIYRDGKKYSKLYTVSVAGQSFPVKSTRVGIVRIGEGLFTANQVSSKDYTAAVNSLLRISVFVHEARHSDGNGINAGFPHALCTQGTFAGRYSCEENLNGPYSIEAILLSSFYASCTDCDTTDREALKAAAIDAFSRIQGNAQFRDSRPERIQ